MNTEHLEPGQSVSEHGAPRAGSITAGPRPAGTGTTRVALSSWIGPLGVGVFPVLLHYAGNARELALSELVIPLLASCAGAAILCFALQKVLRDPLAGSLASMAFLALFYTTAPVIAFASATFQTTLRHRVVVPVALAIWLGVVLLLRRHGDSAWRARLVASLAIVAALLVAYNASALVVAELRKSTSSARLELIQQRPAAGIPHPAGPDIVVLVADELAGFPTIHDQWGLDNEPFARFLEANGFFVAREARSRYCTTLFSLTSLLNLDYVAGPISNDRFWELLKSKKVEAEYREIAGLHGMLQNSKVTDFLRSRGYTIVTINNHKDLDPVYPGFVQGDIALRALGEGPRTRTGSFLLFLAKQTMLQPLAYRIEEQVLDLLGRRRTVLLSSLRSVVEAAALPGPKLVLAYFLCPHTPFIFRADGTMAPPQVANNWREKRWYREQYSFMVARLQDVITRVLDAQGDEVIILLVSDHGPRPFSSPVAEENLRIPTEYPVEDMFRVINAIRAPRVPAEELRPTLAPVNDFRLILKHYFGENLPPVADE